MPSLPVAPSADAPARPSVPQAPPVFAPSAQAPQQPPDTVGSNLPDVDVLIVGAGPAGLALARHLQALPITVGLVDQAPWDALAQPAFDGREIALTPHSMAVLQRLGAWGQWPADAQSPIRAARVLNGPDPVALTIGSRDARQRADPSAPDALGALVGNHHVRRALWAAVNPVDARHPMPSPPQPGQPPGLVCGQAVTAVQLQGEQRVVTLSDGRTWRANLLVAADSRHSAVRRGAGIAADVQDMGRSMMVCAVTHERPHDHVAWEWFDHGQTLALLPMQPCPHTGRHRASVVLTLPGEALAPVAALDDAALGADLTRRFAGRLGAMAVASTRHVYPLVSVYPRRLVAPHLACVGDAACGMHPVTAHGFNLGLRSVEALSRGLAQAIRAGRSVADPAMLARYERTHRLASRPLYLATQWLADGFVRETPMALGLRQTVLRLARGLPPVRQALARWLMRA